MSRRRLVVALDLGHAAAMDEDLVGSIGLALVRLGNRLCLEGVPALGTTIPVVGVAHKVVGMARVEVVSEPAKRKRPSELAKMQRELVRPFSANRAVRHGGTRGR